MNRIAITGIFLSSALFTSIPDASAAQTVWSSALFLEGTGVTNCGMARATEDGNARCRAYVEQLGRDNPDAFYKLKDIYVYNHSVTEEEGPAWDRWRKCTYRASVQCLYAVAQ